MKKIYIVVADNGQSYEEHRHWNVAAFASEESASAFIDNFTEEICAAERREEELEILFDERGFRTLEEEEEYERVHRLACMYWHFFDDGEFIIREMDLHE